MTKENQTSLSFHSHFKREVVADFNGSTISSDGGALLLRSVDKQHGLIAQACKAFQDHRDQESIEHDLQALVRQRVFGLCLGYDDLNDHDYLLSDSLLAIACGREDFHGHERHRQSDRGKVLASSSTLNRLELAVPADASSGPQIDRYHRIAFDPQKGQDFFTDVFLSAHTKIPQEIILDLDATDDRLHGNQEGRFWHGYYRCYCYLPLYIFCGHHLLWAELRQSNQDGAAGSVEAVEKIIARIRRDPRWKHVRIIIRADSGFCRNNLMDWCESHNVDFILGLAKNNRLKKITGKEMGAALEACKSHNEAVATFSDFHYSTQKSWTKERRVVAKNEALPSHEADGKPKANHRFVVTSLPKERIPAQELYREWYCQRGEMENRIKEQQLDLFADRTSTAHLWSNQIRLWFASVAYVIMHALRERTLAGTAYANAQCGTIRLRLLKIGAVIRTTTRRIYVHLSGSHPAEPIWRHMAPLLS